MKNNENLYLNQSLFGLWLVLLGLALLLSMNRLQVRREALAERIAPGILRFHVMADSDDAADQAVKLEVRSLLLDFLEGRLPARADKDMTVSYVSNHREELEALADELLAREGFDYRASLSVVHDYFPSRTYAGLTFPCGNYDAVRVILGSGRGHNWWCVLYPKFCFVDGVCSEIPAESMDILKNSINEEDFLLLSRGFSERNQVSDPKINPDPSRNPDYSEVLPVNESRPELSLRLHLFPDFLITLCLPDL